MGSTSVAGTAVIIGSVCSAALILVIGMLIIKFSKRLPIHQVFKISSITMIVLAVVLAGRGIKELQEAAFIGVDLLSFRFSFDMLGFYPTIQTASAQVITLIIALVLWFYNKKKQTPIKPVAVV
jgi:high-affinity iron transporter